MAVHLVYIDDSGNTGNRRDDPQQPYHVAAGVVVNASKWHSVRRDFAGVLERHRVQTTSPDFEIKGAELYRGRGRFGGWPEANRKRLMLGLLAILGRRRLPVLGIAIEKKSLQSRLLVPRSLFRYLLWHVSTWTRVRRRPNDLVLVIADENKSVEATWQQVLRTMRASAETGYPPEVQALMDLWERAGFAGEEAADLGTLRQRNVAVNDLVLDQVHFVQSHESFGIQLADLCAYIINQHLQGRDRLGVYERVSSRFGIPLGVLAK